MAETTAVKTAKRTRTPSLGVDTTSITIDLPKALHDKFMAEANKELLPLKLYLVRELAGLNAKVVIPTVTI